jgi:predicted PurR-regulated permease PerM
MASTENTGTIVHKAAVTIAVVLFALLLIAALYYTFDVLMLVFAAALLAIFLRGIAELLSYYVKLSDGWLVLLVSVLLIAFLGGFIALLSPSIAEQATLLRDKIPSSVQKVTDFLNQYGWGRTLIQNLPSYDAFVANLNASNLLSGVGGFFTSTMGVLGNIGIVVLLAIYLATEPKRRVCASFPAGAPRPCERGHPRDLSDAQVVADREGGVDAFHRRDHVDRTVDPRRAAGADIGADRRAFVVHS